MLNDKPVSCTLRLTQNASSRHIRVNISFRLPQWVRAPTSFPKYRDKFYRWKCLSHPHCECDCTHARRLGWTSCRMLHNGYCAHASEPIGSTCTTYWNMLNDHNVALELPHLDALNSQNRLHFSSFTESLFWVKTTPAWPPRSPPFKVAYFGNQKYYTTLLDSQLNELSNIW